MKKINKEDFHILKTEEAFISKDSFSQSQNIKKVVTQFNVANIIKLLFLANNDINPRNATNNKIVKDICDTLETNPDLFWVMTKGIVIATRSCSLLERNRIRISLYNPAQASDLTKSQEGIMDGGHNAFAIAYFIASHLFENLKKWKQWSDFKDFWTTHYDEIIERFEKLGGNDFFTFKIPVEIISPLDEDDSDYCDAISEICDARNNNAQLGQPAKDNQEGCYDYLKEVLSNYPIIWKPGQEDGNIRIEDVISMAVIPLIFLQSKAHRISSDIPYGTLNPVSVYSQKGACVKFFSRVLTSTEFSEKPEGLGKYILKSGLIKSALDMTEDIMNFFDLLYENFPTLYNNTGGSFGNIKKVESGEKGKNKNYLFHTIDRWATHKYPYGFLYPLLLGVIELMEYDEKNDIVKWKINPTSPQFNFEDLDISLFAGFFSTCGYNPQEIGKSKNYYDAASLAFQFYALKYGTK